MCQSRSHPSVSEGLNSWMAGWNVVSLSNKAVSIVSHIVLDVSVASDPDFNVRTIRVGRPEVGNVESVSGDSRLILYEGRCTGWRGLLLPMPAKTV